MSYLCQCLIGKYFFGAFIFGLILILLCTIVELFTVNENVTDLDVLAAREADIFVNKDWVKSIRDRAFIFGFVIKNV